MYIILTEMGHLSLSLLIGYACFKFFKRISGFVPALLSGFFVDFDHLIDYFIHKGLSFDVSNFISGRHYHETNTSYIFFHSWELVLFLGVLTYYSKKKYFWCPLVLGLTFHLLWDYLTNPVHWYTYFFTARYLLGFALDKLFVF